MSDQKKPRAQRTRRAVAAASVATMLGLGGVMAWSDAHATSTKTVVSSSSSGTSASGSDDSSYDDSGSSSSSSSSSTGSSSSSSSSTITPHTSTGGS
jgi:endoglucanase